MVPSAAWKEAKRRSVAPYISTATCAAPISAQKPTTAKASRGSNTRCAASAGAHSQRIVGKYLKMARLHTRMATSAISPSAAMLNQMMSCASAKVADPAAFCHVLCRVVFVCGCGGGCSVCIVSFVIIQLANHLPHHQQQLKVRVPLKLYTHTYHDFGHKGGTTALGNKPCKGVEDVQAARPQIDTNPAVEKGMFEPVR